MFAASIYLLTLNVTTFCGPWLAARWTLRARGWQWGLFGLAVVYWFGVLASGGILTGLLFGQFSSGKFAVVAVGLSALLGLTAFAGRDDVLSRSERRQSGPAAWELYPLVALAALTMLWNLFALDVLPVRIWETLNYRGVTVGMWMQGAPLRGFETSSFAAYTYPANSELLQLWWCIHTHCERWIEMPQWLVGLALADFVGLLAKEAGVPPRGRWWAAALVLLIPVVAIQAATEQDDLTTAAGFVGGLIFLRRWLYDEGGASRNAFAAGVCIGFALGSKVVMIPFLVPVVLWVIWKWRRTWRTLPAFLAPIALLGFYFYADNLIRFGNPLYPFPVRLFGITLFAADPARPMPEFLPGGGNLLAHLAPVPAEWFEAHADVPAFSEASGFGAIWPALILPALVVVVIERLAHAISPPPPTPLPRRGEGSGFWPLALVVAAGEVLMWSNTLWTPFDLRYSMHLPALGAVPAALCLCRCRGVWRGTAGLVAIVLGAWTAGNTIANNWNSPISRIMELRRLPYEQRTYAKLDTMPEAKLFATLEANGQWPASKSVALLTPLSALRSAAFGNNFERRVWNPDPLKLNPGRWAREVEARQIDTVLVINNADTKFGSSAEAQADLANPQRWTQVFNQPAPGIQMLAYRRVQGKEK